MTSHFITSYCESARRYPYVSKISVGEEDCVDFIYQFVRDCYPVTNIYATFCKSHTGRYISGAPTKFPKYGDFPRTFIMKTYGFDISISPWQDDAQVECIPHSNRVNKCFELEFKEAVYPIRVSIYEIYNPGNIIEIWAQDSSNYQQEIDNSRNYQWFLLWEGSPQIVPPTSRLFSPPLKSCNFKTNVLRLKFKHSVFDYHTNIDAVMLIGTSELILPRNPRESLTDLLRGINCMYPYHKDVHNLTADYENAHLDIGHLQKNFAEHCIICERHKEASREVIPNYVWEIVSISQILLEIIRNPSYAKHMKLSSDKSRNSPKHNQKLLGCPNPAKRMKLSLDETGELSRCSLSAFPDEIILKILKNLDLKTLCRMNQINRRFYNLTRDPRLYTRLNLRYITCIKLTRNIFSYFASRCEYLQQLDLTCSDFFASDFEEFLENCGKRLTHLRLSKCEAVNNDALLKISKTCKNLKELDLTMCKKIRNKGFSYLENLENLEHLKLGYTELRSNLLSKILQKNKRIRELNLESISYIDVDAVAIELGKSCQDLEIIIFGRYGNRNVGAGFISSEGINALAGCKNLRKIFFEFERYAFIIDSLSRLFASCQRLEEIHLSDDTVFTFRNLRLLTQCKNLKRLHFHKVRIPALVDTCSVIFEQCPKLQELYLAKCIIYPNLSYIRHYIYPLRERYPHVFIDITS